MQRQPVKTSNVSLKKCSFQDMVHCTHIEIRKSQTIKQSYGSIQLKFLVDCTTETRGGGGVKAWGRIITISIFFIF